MLRVISVPSLMRDCVVCMGSTRDAE